MVRTLNITTTVSPSSHTTHKIKKTIKEAVKMQRSVLFQPIDKVINQCLDIHKTLKRSHRLLSEFTRELRTISEHLNNMHYDDQLDALTVNCSLEDESAVLDHRLIFGRIDNGEDCSDSDFSEEHFKKEFLESITTKPGDSCVNSARTPYTLKRDSKGTAQYLSDFDKGSDSRAGNL